MPRRRGNLSHWPAQGYQTINLKCNRCGDFFSVEGPGSFTRIVRNAWRRTHNSPYGCKVAERTHMQPA
jgi:hypothetical protein